jgi:allantoinase
VDTFDEMLEHSRSQPLVFGIALHAFLVGQPFRLRYLRRALEHVVSHRQEIWLATSGAIARSFAERVPATP